MNRFDPYIRGAYKSLDYWGDETTLVILSKFLNTYFVVFSESDLSKLSVQESCIEKKYDRVGLLLISNAHSNGAHYQAVSYDEQFIFTPTRIYKILNDVLQDDFTMIEGSRRNSKETSIRSVMSCLR